MANDIQINIKKSDNVLRVPIFNSNDEDTGKYLQFDVEDVTNAVNFQECIEMHKKNIAFLNNQRIIISKKQDHKGKKLLSSNEEEFCKALQEFYKREIQALDLFIGKGKTEMILAIEERNPYFSMFEDFQKMLEPVYPVLIKAYNDFKEKIEKKYTIDDNILE